MTRKSGFVFIIILVLAITSIGTVPVMAEGKLSAEKDIVMFVDGLQVNCAISPEAHDNHLFLPVKNIADALDVDIAWDDELSQLTAERDDTCLVMRIGTGYALLNDNEVKIDIGPRLMHGILAVPAEFFSETFGYQADYDPIRHRVDIDLPPDNMKVLSYFIPGDENSINWERRSRDSVHNRLVNELALGWYSMTKDGLLLTGSPTGWYQPEGWEEILTDVWEQGFQTEMVIYMSNYDGKIDKLVANEEARHNAITAIIEEVALYDGVDLDFEGLGENKNLNESEKTRSDFNIFVSELSAQLQEKGKRLTLTLHAPNTVFSGYDYKTLGELADQIIIMAYDYDIETTGPEPGHKVDEALEMACEMVPPEKLLLGISTTSEDHYTLRDKLGIARRNGVKGIALWYWGSVNEHMWQVLDNRIIPYEPSEDEDLSASDSIS